MTNEPTQPLPESVAAIIKSAAKKISLESSRQFLSAGDCECILSAALVAPIQELLRYKRALENHLCEYERADWLGCNMDHNGNYCDVCESDPEEHQHKKITKLISAAESRGRDAGLEEAALLAEKISDYDYTTSPGIRCREGIRALKTSAPEVKS